MINSNALQGSVLVLRPKVASIFYVKENELGTFTPPFDVWKKFYQTSTIIDEKGFVYSPQEVVSVSYAGIKWWIRFLGPVKKINMRLEHESTMDLSGLKEVLKQKIQDHPKYWERKDNYEKMSNEIDGMASFEEIFKYFR